jgi:hypothetical protein
MLSRRRAAITVCFTSCFMALSATAGIVVDVQERAISVAGVTPGGRVALLGYTRQVAAGPQQPMKEGPYSEFLDADRDGIVRLDFESGVPAQGMWAAVDLTTGDHVAFTSPGFDATRLNFTELARKDSVGQLRKIEWPLGQMDAFVVRPGEGVWSLFASAGSELDDNRGGHGPLRLDLDSMKGVHTSKAPPSAFRPGDVIVVFDRYEMQYGTEVVGR